MMKNKKPVFDAGIEPEELEKILQSIDANLAGKPVSYSVAAVENKVQPAPRSLILPAPAPVPDFASTITLIRNARAPYYVVSGSLPGRIVKKGFNLFIKVFGRKQAYYNELTLDVLGALAAHTNTVQQQNLSQVSVINDLVDTVAQLEHQMEELQMAPVKKQKGSAVKPKSQPARKKTAQGKR
jgi:hypothetical protein